MVFTFPQKHYVVTPHLKCLKIVQMRYHNIGFYAELTEIILITINNSSYLNYAYQ